MDIYIIDENKYFAKKDIKYLKSILKSSLKYFDISNKSEICLTFIDDLQIRYLNKNFRSIDRVTDVLSFPQQGPASDLLGDIVISYETAKRHSARHRKKLMDEIKHLIIHGLLHLLGYDHKKKKDAIIMRLKEKELLDQIQA